MVISIPRRQIRQINYCIVFCVWNKICIIYLMEVAISKLTYYCNRSIGLYTAAIAMTGRANLIDIFSSLKSRRLRLLKFIGREPTENNLISSQIHGLTDVLSELKSNEQHLIELSTELLKTRRIKSSGFKELVKSSVSEIRSSLHWLDVISSYYKRRKAG